MLVTSHGSILKCALAYEKILSDLAVFLGHTEECLTHRQLTGDVSYSMAFSAKPCNEYFVVLLNEI